MLASQAALSPTVIQVAQVADYGKTGADVASYLRTGRSMVDNVVGKVANQDCQMLRILEGNYCNDIVEPQED